MTENLSTEPEGVIRRRTECTPSDEVCGLYAIYQAVLEVKVFVGKFQHNLGGNGFAGLQEF